MKSSGTSMRTQGQMTGIEFEGWSMADWELLPWHSLLLPPPRYLPLVLRGFDETGIAEGKPFHSAITIDATERQE